jgi:hypothetical protein
VIPRYYHQAAELTFYQLVWRYEHGFGSFQGHEM